jgi:hypothetical protein
MIKITVDMWPYGDADNQYNIAEGKIELQNVHPETNQGNYCYFFFQEGNKSIQRVDKKGTITEHHRSEGVLKLIYLALKDIYEENNG